MAWFTNKELLGLLTEKVRKGVSVEIISSDDAINQRLPTREFIRAGGKSFVYTTQGSLFLHEKFALFDESKLVTGSYNWTYGAEHYNHESVIISDDATLIKQYQTHFQKLVGRADASTATTWATSTPGTEGVIESHLQQLEEQLLQEFYHTLTEAKSLKVPINVEFVRDYLERYGAIGAAKRLLATGQENVQAGFIKLCEVDRKDLTFESIILHDQYRKLFNDKVLEQAAKRLRNSA